VTLVRGDAKKNAQQDVRALVKTMQMADAVIAQGLA
jgi:hypothetical protein